MRGTKKLWSQVLRKKPIYAVMKYERNTKKGKKRKSWVHRVFAISRIFHPSQCINGDGTSSPLHHKQRNNESQIPMVHSWEESIFTFKYQALLLFSVLYNFFSYSHPNPDELSLLRSHKENGPYTGEQWWLTKLVCTYVRLVETKILP